MRLLHSYVGTLCTGYTLYYKNCVDLLLILQFQVRQISQWRITSLTIGGFTQPAVSRPIIELPSNIEKGLSSRFLWFFPKPCYCKFETLEPVDDDFTRALSKMC